MQTTETNGTTIPAAWLEQVEKARRAKRLTKQALAEAVRLSKPTITRLYQGKASPSTIREVAVYLSLPDPLAEDFRPDPMEEWITLGKDLLDHDPHRFQTIIDFMRAAATAREKSALLARDLAK